LYPYPRKHTNQTYKPSLSRARALSLSLPPPPHTHTSSPAHADVMNAQKLESAAQRRKNIEDAKNEHMKVSSRQNYVSKKQASRRGSRNSSSDNISRLGSSEQVSPKVQTEFLLEAPRLYAGGSRVAPEQVGNGEARGAAGAGAANKYAHAHDKEAEEAEQVEEEQPDSELLALEEYQVVMFLFPERNLLISFGELDIHGPVVEACRDVLQNRKSAVVSDLLDETPGCGNGAATLLVAMLDATMDLTFPIMAKFSDALEGLQVMASEYCSEFHVATSNQIKMQMTQVRRFVWDSRALFMELSQDMSGALGPVSRMRAHVLLESTKQLEKEAEANMEQCRHVEAIYAGVQDAKMNSSLYFLTRLSLLCIPVQTISGWYGMNFEMPDGALALDGSECSRKDTPLWVRERKRERERESCRGSESICISCHIYIIFVVIRLEYILFHVCSHTYICLCVCM
jgi:Mg2+ and Co2+ transporter CorA